MEIVYIVFGIIAVLAGAIKYYLHKNPDNIGYKPVAAHKSDYKRKIKELADQYKLNINDDPFQNPYSSAEGVVGGYPFKIYYRDCDPRPYDPRAFCLFFEKKTFITGKMYIQDRRFIIQGSRNGLKFTEMEKILDLENAEIRGASEAAAAAVLDPEIIKKIGEIFPAGAIQIMLSGNGIEVARNMYPIPHRAAIAEIVRLGKELLEFLPAEADMESRLRNNYFTSRTLRRKKVYLSGYLSVKPQITEDDEIVKDALNSSVPELKMIAACRLGEKGEEILKDIYIKSSIWIKVDIVNYLTEIGISSFSGFLLEQWTDSGKLMTALVGYFTKISDTRAEMPLLNTLENYYQERGLCRLCLKAIANCGTWRAAEELKKYESRLPREYIRKTSAALYKKLENNADGMLSLQKSDEAEGKLSMEEK